MQARVIAERFELLARAGSGGMCSVYRARDRKAGRLVAVKLLRGSDVLDIARFEREAAVLARLHSPNVVDYIAHGEADGIHYLVQEWIDGMTLGSLLYDRGVTIAEAVAVGLGVAEALAATHALNIIHRDVKPANILLVDGSPSLIKLVDYGIARATAQAGVLTRTGLLVGTPAYMAPEQARGDHAIGPAADVWALGCVLYEALTGRVAFAGQTPASIRAKVLLEQPPPVHTLCPEAPAELAALVEAMLAKAPAARAASGAEVAARLRALPPISDGPRRKAGASMPPTVVMPAHSDAPRGGATTCFVMVSAVDRENEDAAASPDQREHIAEIATRYGMDLHLFEDGTPLLAGRAPGLPGAREAARAGLELRSRAREGAVSVFGRAFDESFDQAIERGSSLLERATVSSLFHDLTNTGASLVHLDPIIAELVHADLRVLHTEKGPVLHAEPQVVDARD